jgi:membrane-associated protein
MLGVLDISTWIQEAGILTALLIIGVIIFAESGLLIGIFLPGDTLLFAAGLLAAQGHLPLAGVISVITIAAVLGDNAGYWFGRKTGPRLFRKQNGIFFRREHARRAEIFFKKHGAKTVLIARFIPYIRTFTPMVAGVAKMHRPLFIIYNIIGAALWAVSTILIGYWLGDRIPNVERYIIPGVVAIALVVFAPTVWHILSNRRARKQILAKMSKKRR